MEEEYWKVKLLLSWWATLVGLFIGLLLHYYYAPYWGVRKVPGPPTVPFIGHLPLLAKYGPDVFTILSKKYGPIFRFHMGRQPLVVVADPELCREVGIRKFKSVANRSVPSPISASPLHQKGLFFTRDERWVSMRNTILSLYQPSHLANLIPTMQKIIEAAFSNLSAVDEVIFSDLSLKLATDVIGQTAFGVDFKLTNSSSAADADDDDGEEATEFIKLHMYSTKSLKMDLSGSLSIILGLIFPILQKPFRQILKRIRGTSDCKIDRNNNRLSKWMDAIVAKRTYQSSSGNGCDFLSSIVKARDSSEFSRNLFTQDYISGLIYEHLLAGSATTSFTLSVVLYLVSKNRQVEEKVLKEVDMFVTNGGHVSNIDELQHKFQYIDQVIKESMRFYTVSPLVARETSHQIEVADYILPKGTWVWLALGVLAKDPQNFSDPDVFRPERFDPSNEEEKRRHRYAHIPFGIGPRACIGQRFALLEIKLSLIYLYQRYTFKHSNDMESPLQFDYGIILNFKHGVKLHVIKRIKS